MLPDSLTFSAKPLLFFFFVGILLSVPVYPYSAYADTEEFSDVQFLIENIPKFVVKIGYDYDKTAVPYLIESLYIQQADAQVEYKVTKTTKDTPTEIITETATKKIVENKLTGSKTLTASVFAKTYDGVKQQWADYVIDDSRTSLIIQKAVGSVIFDKPTCTLTVYDSDDFRDSQRIGQHNIKFEESPVGLDTWTDITATNSDCSTASSTNGTHIFITGIQDESASNQKAVFNHTYSVAIGANQIESFGSYTNVDPNKEKNHKIKFIDETQVLNSNVIRVNHGESLTKSKITDFVLLGEDADPSEGEFELVTSTGDKIIHDITKEKDNKKWKVQKIGNKIITEFECEAALGNGERCEYDPTTTWDTGEGSNWDEFYKDSGNDICDTYGSTKTDSDNAIQVYDSSHANDCFLPATYFGGLSELSGQILDSGYIELHIGEVDSPRLIDVILLDSDCETSDSTTFDEIIGRDGAVVIDNTDGWNSVGTNKQVSFGDITGIQAEIDAGDLDFCFGYRFDSLATDGSEHAVKFWGETAPSATPKPTLSLTYHENEKDIIATINENDNSTSVGNAKVTFSNSSASVTKQMDGTGSHTDPFPGISGAVNHNVTVTEADFGYVVNQSVNSILDDANYVAISNIFRIDCSSDGTGTDDVRIMTNSSYDSITGTMGHYISSFTTPTCNGNDEIKWSVTYTANGSALSSNPTYDSEVKASILDIDSFGFSPEKFAVDTITVPVTFASNNVTSDTFDVGTSMTTVTKKFYLRLTDLEDPSVKAYESDGSTIITTGNVTQTNSTALRSVALDASGVAQFTGLNSMQNFTVKETTDNYVVKKLVNQNITTSDTITATSNVYRIKCPSDGFPDDIDVILKVNDTDGHFITSFTAPTCDPNDKITWNVQWNGTGVKAFGDPSYTSRIIAEIVDTGNYGANADKFTQDGNTVGTSYSSDKIISDPFTVGTSSTTKSSSFLLDLGALGQQSTPISSGPTKNVVALTIPIAEGTLNKDEILVLLDTTGSGSLDLLSVTANLPCAGAAEPEPGASNDVPNLNVTAGVLGNTTKLIESESDDTGYLGPNDTCVFRSFANSTDQGITVHSLLLENNSNSTVSIPKLVMVTITGIFNED